MKSIFTLPIALALTMMVSAQSKNPSSAKEVQDRIKQAQQALDQLTPEQRKMMEQIGISSKVPGMPAGVTGANVKAAVAGGAEFGVPSRNAALIATIPKVTLTEANVAAYLTETNKFISDRLSIDGKTSGEYFYKNLQSNKYDAAAIANSAIGIWVSGQLETAVYLMGKATADDAKNTENLSNFTAMLSMAGAPQMAIPLLEFLNKKYPDNTTILNNLGQAWFYLGETDKANAHLDKVVKAFAYHPQANYTQCLIQQSKGNTSGAIEKMKNSLQYSYSSDKINMLRKLGYKVKGSDMRIPFRPDPNPLGLRNFLRPEAPISYDTEIKLRADWNAFQKQIDEKNTQLSQALQPYIQSNVQQAQKMYDQYQKGGVKGMKARSALSENMYSAMADIRLNEMNKDGGAGYRLKAAKSAIDALLKDYNTKKETQKKALIKQYSLRADQESELAKKGEDIGYDVCVVELKFSEWVYSHYNKPLEEAYQQYLHQLYLKITEELYWKQFKYTAAAFEPEKINAKKEWLAALRNTRYIETYSGNNDCLPKQDNNSGFKLADFDDMHCAYRTELDFGVWKQIFECGRSRIEFDAGRLKGKFNFKFDDKGNNHLGKSTLEATVIDKSVSIDKGPLQIGASVKAGVGVEFTGKGVEDVYVTGEAAVNVKSNIIKTFDKHISDANNSKTPQPGMGDAQLSDKGVEIGVSGKMSLISGNRSTNVFVNTPQ